MAPLTSRQARVLRDVVDAHVATGRAVGSGTLARRGTLEVSPATLRHIMAELEDMGLLAQPHKSAGRVPTDRAYRLYVDELMPAPRVAAAQARRVQDALSQAREQVTDVVSAAPRLLSRFSRQAALVLAPGLERMIAERFEFVRQAERRVMAIVVGRGGLVEHRAFAIDEDMAQDDLDRCARMLTEEFAGRSLRRIRAALRRRVAQERAEWGRLRVRSLDLGRRTVGVDRRRGEIIVDGASNLLELPEFADVSRVRELLRALEGKERLVQLLERLMDSDEVQVVIGEENPLQALAGCSVVASAYRAAERPLGAIGIVGPTRMDYTRAIALVRYLADSISGILTAERESSTGRTGRI